MFSALSHLECPRCAATYDAFVRQGLCPSCASPLLARYDLAYRPFLLSDSAPPLAHFSNLARFFAELLAVPGIAAIYRAGEIQSHYAARVRDAKPADDQTQGDNQ